MMGRGKEAGLPIGDAQPAIVPADDAIGGVDEGKRPPRGRVELSELTRNRLAVSLRAMYDTVAQQPVPERFADLIAQLESSERRKP